MKQLNFSYSNEERLHVEFHMFKRIIEDFTQLFLLPWKFLVLSDDIFLFLRLCSYKVQLLSLRVTRIPMSFLKLLL